MPRRWRLAGVHHGVGQAFADLVNWDEDADPYEGQRVLLADGGSERIAALISEIRGDGTVVLSVPAHAKPLRVTAVELLRYDDLWNEALPVSRPV